MKGLFRPRIQLECWQFCCLCNGCFTIKCIDGDHCIICWMFFFAMMSAFAHHTRPSLEQWIVELYCKRYRVIVLLTQEVGTTGENAESRLFFLACSIMSPPPRCNLGGGDNGRYTSDQRTLKFFNRPGDIWRLIPGFSWIKDYKLICETLSYW